MIAPFLAKLQSAGRLPDSDRALLTEMFQETQSIPMRRDIIREGERPDHVHLMIEGWACRYNILADGSRQITAFLLPGDFCDTHITIFPAMDHAIGSLTDSTVAYIPRDRMLALTERPAIARAFWWGSLVDEAILRAWIVNLGRRDARDRVAHLICELHARLKNIGLVEDGAFELPLTQEELSDALGLTSVHVGRQLKWLRHEGLMTFKRQQIVITNIAALQSVCGFDENYLHMGDK